MNDVISLKRQTPKASTSYSQPYQDIPRRYPNQQGGGGGRQLQLPPIQQRLAIEAPPLKANSCVFHLTDEHDGSSCPEMVHFSQMISKGETILEVDEGFSQIMLGNSEIHYMKYVSDSERGGNMLVSLEDFSYAILTRTQ